LKHGFPKSHRLSSRIEKERLLREGKKIFVHPILLRWLPRIGAGRTSSISPAKVMILVAKKKFPRAVDRNAIRRKLREAWRLYASESMRGSADFVHPAMFLLHYVGQAEAPFAEIRSVLSDALHKLPRNTEQNLSE